MQQRGRTLRVGEQASGRHTRRLCIQHRKPFTTRYSTPRSSPLGQTPPAAAAASHPLILCSFTLLFRSAPPRAGHEPLAAPETGGALVGRPRPQRRACAHATSQIGSEQEMWEPLQRGQRQWGQPLQSITRPASHRRSPCFSGHPTGLSRSPSRQRRRTKEHWRLSSSLLRFKWRSRERVRRRPWE